MSWATWALLAFVTGFARHYVWGGAPAAVMPPAIAAPPPSLVFLLKGMAWTGLAIVIFAIYRDITNTEGLFKGWGLPSAYSVEEFVTRSRTLCFALWWIFGWCASIFRVQIGDNIGKFYEALLGKDHESAWALQAALALFVLFGLVFFFHPELIDKIESFKAGEVEAKFVAVSSAKLQSINISYLKSAHESYMVLQYDDFQIFKTKECDNYMEDDNITPILKIYKSAMSGNVVKNRYWKLDIACHMIMDVFMPLVIQLKCLDGQGRFVIQKYNEKFREFSVELQNLTKNTLSTSATTAIFNKHLNATISDYINLRNQLQGETEKHIYELEESRDNEKQLSTCKDSIHENSTSDSDLKRLSDKIIKIKDSSSSLKGEDLYPFEAYVIAIIGDVIAFCESQAHKAEYLEMFKSKFSFSSSGAAIPLPGNINILSQTLDAKLNSDESWPFGETFQDVKDLKSAEDQMLNYIWSNRMTVNGHTAEWLKERDIKNHFSRFTDLAQTLQFFNSRALSGEKIPLEGRFFWERTYKESRQVLAILGKVTTFSMEEMSSDERGRWLEAKSMIDANEDVVFDLTHSAALSAVLIPEQTGEVSSSDCAGARALLEWAKHYVNNLAESSTKAPFAGLIEQIALRTDAVCAK